MDDTVFKAIISWQFILFCLGIAAITFVFKKGVEFFVLDNPKMPGTRTSKFWGEFILPIFPIVSGSLVGLFAPKYPFPEYLHATSGRVIFGLVAGMLSSTIYRMMNAFLKSKLGISDVEDATAVASAAADVSAKAAQTAANAAEHADTVAKDAAENDKK